MVCPICGKSVTFPAIPPGAKKVSLPSQRVAAARVRQWPFDVKKIFPFLARFDYWNVVLVCLVPFIIVAALLVGAGIVRKHFGSDAIQPAAPAVVHADPREWQKMSARSLAEQKVQEQIAAVTQAKAAAANAERNLARLQAAYQGKRLDQLGIYNMNREMQAGQQAVANAQKCLETARQSFDNAFRAYQDLGGQIDYRRQLPY
jgi:hypothetical protein